MSTRHTFLGAQIIVFTSFGLVFGGMSSKLLKAAQNNDIDKVEVLISKGVDINYKNKEKWTALMFAAENSNPDMVRLLLDNGANVNTKNTSSDDALGLVCYNGAILYEGAEKATIDIVNQLLQSGAKANSSNLSGETPLHFATENGLAVVALMLIKNGGNMSRIDNMGISPIDIAYSKKHFDFLVALMKDSLLVDIDVSLLFVESIIAGEYRTVEFLVNRGIDCHTRHNGLLPLELALAYNRTDIVEFLMANGAIDERPTIEASIVKYNQQRHPFPGNTVMPDEIKIYQVFRLDNAAPSYRYVLLAQINKEYFQRTIKIVKPGMFAIITESPSAVSSREFRELPSKNYGEETEYTIPSLYSLNIFKINTSVQISFVSCLLLNRRFPKGEITSNFLTNILGASTSTYSVDIGYQTHVFDTEKLEPISESIIIKNSDLATINQEITEYNLQFPMKRHF